MTIERVIAAATLVFATTADDAFWLIPFLSKVSSQHRSAPRTRTRNTFGHFL